MLIQVSVSYIFKTVLGNSGDRFGWSVAIAGDFMAIGGYDFNGRSGKVRIYKKDGNDDWNLIQTLTGPSNSFFGWNIDMDEDDLVIGAYNEDASTTGGAVYFYQRSGDTYVQRNKFGKNPNDYHGFCVAVKNQYAIVGADFYDGTYYNDVGVAFAYKRSGSTWIEEHMINPPTQALGRIFGYSASLEYYNSEYIAVIGEGYIGTEGSAYVFLRNGGTWDDYFILKSLDIDSSDHFGSAVSIYQDYILVGAENKDSGKGAAYIFKRNGAQNVWYQLAKLTHPTVVPTDHFGYAVSLYGDYAVVRGYISGALIFKRNGNNWDFLKRIIVNEQNAGGYYTANSAKIDQDYIVLGSTPQNKANVYSYCNGLACYNGGTPDQTCSTCQCTGHWEVPDCTSCGLSCFNSGIVDGDCSACICKNFWDASDDCQTCTLSCDNSGTASNDCSVCNCQNHWSSASNCSDCGLVCQNSGSPNSECSKCGNCNDLVCIHGTKNNDCSECVCDDGYSGDSCEEYECYGIPYQNVTSCSVNGTCIKPNECKCDDAYQGKQCETWKCSTLQTSEDYYWEYQDGCKIICTDGKIAVGTTCFDENFLVGTVVGSIGIASAVVVLCILFFIVLLVIICVLFKKATKFNHIEGAEMILKEAELQQKDASTPKIKINNSSVIVDYSEIQLKKVIGQGGSETTVYKAEWKGMICAYKGYNTSAVGTESFSFEDFEKEVAVCVNVNHPSILQFYGACINPPRIGFLIEYAENGDIPSFLGKYKSKMKKKYPFKEKLRILKEICSGMDYLHGRQFMHRDLKPENILINGEEKAKIMDFGLSRMKTKDEKTMTKMIGTSFYMAPEVAKGGNYSFSCDVYSFSMLAFVFIIENLSPFGSEISDQMIMKKVSQNPNFRPQIDEKLFEECKGLLKIIKKNWSFDPKERNTFSEIQKELKTLKMD